MAAATESRHLFPSRHQGLAPDDFDTASIHSAAPSYVSETPSYHTVAAHSESIPPYTPPGTLTTPHSSFVQATPRSLLPEPNDSSSFQETIGLPPIPPVGATAPTLNSFRIATWSTVNSNPTYQNVARRRAQAEDCDPVSSLRRAIFLDRLAEEEETAGAYSSSSSSSPSPSRSPAPQASSSLARPPPAAARRPLEDPGLVGDEAAAQARRRRMARENGNDVLVAENRHWDWFLAQQGDSEERERSWARFRREVSSGQRRKLSRRLAGRLF